MTIGYVERMREYVRRVLSRTEIAGQLEILACERFERDWSRAETDPDWPYRFDEESAVRPCAFIEGLRHIQGVWAQHRLYIELEDWQLFLVCNLFGWVRRDNGMRRFSTAYWEVARKNTKSTLGAAIGLYMFAADGEAGAEVYSAATTGKQAGIVFNIARAMVKRESEFIQAGILAQKRGIYMPDDERKFEPLNAEGSTLDGLNVHCAIVDELHAHVKRDVFDVIDTARGARDQPLMLCITTAGANRAGICFEQRTYLVNVLRKTFTDENYFGVIYTIDDQDVWSDPRVWRKANPNYGISVRPEDFERAAHRAANNISGLNNFLTKRLNVWVTNKVAWMDMKLWKACEKPGLTPDDCRHLPCYVGLDLAAKVDLAAKALIFVDEENRKFYLFAHYYINEMAVEQSGNSQYSGWQKKGYLTVTPGNATDLDVIEQDLLIDQENFNIQACCIDPSNATQLTAHMLDAGLPMITIPQFTKYLSEPLKELQALAYTKRLVHDGNPITEWMASNVIAKPMGNSAIFPTKERGENKIDGIIAAILALSRAMQPRQADFSEMLDEPIIG